MVEAEWQLDPLKSMEWTVSTGKVTMKPLEQRTVSIGLKGADVKRLGEERVIGRIKAEGQEFKIDSSLSVIPVPRIKVGMKVDGALGKYAHIDPLVLKSPQDVYPREAIRTETGLLTGDDDIGVTFYMAYDDNNLYLAARVLDDKHLQRQNGVNIWMDDCLQFAFDTKNDALSPDLKGKSGYDGDDYNFGMALTAKGSEAWCWVNPNPAKVGQCAFPVSVRREGKETLYELAIPWEQLAPLKPREGQVFGFSFVVFDNDREADAQAAYWIALTPGVAGGADPSVYKKFMLIPPNSTE